MSSLNPTSLIDSLDDVIQQDLGKGTYDTLPGLDPLIRDIRATSFGVEKSGIGREMQVIHIMEEGVAGSFKWIGVGGGNPMDLGTSAHGVYMEDSQVSEWPGVGDQANPGYFQKTVTLSRGAINVLIPIEFATAVQLDATITNVLASIIRGFAKRIALSYIHNLYARSAQQEIATVGARNNASNRATNDRPTIEVKGGSVRNFHTNMFVDIWNSAGTTKRNTGPVMVDGVRYIPDSGDAGYGLVTLQSVASAAEDLSGIAATDKLVAVGTLSAASASGIGPIGPAQWMATSGTVFGINLATYQQLQSIVAAVSGPVTEAVFNQYFGRMKKAYGMENMPDTIVTSDGVTNVYVENSDGLGRFDRTDKPFIIAAGYEMGDSPFRYNGMTMKWKTSPFMPSDSEMDDASQTGGELWALKLREDNIMRYVAPKLSWSKQLTEFGDEVEFLFAGIGPMGIFNPYKSTNGRTTNYLEAPGQVYCAFLPKFMPGIKLTSLSESL